MLTRAYRIVAINTKFDFLLVSFHKIVCLLGVEIVLIK